MTVDEMEENNVDFELAENTEKNAGAAYKGDPEDLDTAGQIQFYLKKENVPTTDGFTEIPLGDEEEAPEQSPEPTKQADVQAKENPNTYDGILIYTMISLLGFAGLGYTIKKVATR